MTLESDIVKEYLRKHKDLPVLTLAKLIYKDNAAVFKDVESVRDRLRYLTGTRGEGKRQNVIDKEFFRGPTHNYAPFPELPEPLSHYDDWESYRIEGKNVLILADVHIPYFDKKALMAAIEEGKKHTIDTILLLGDWLDDYAQAPFKTDPRKRHFEEELKMSCEGLQWLRNNFPKAHIIYKKGNHDERYERYMMIKAPELISIPNFAFEKVVPFGPDSKDLGIEVVNHYRKVMIGGLTCIHGHEWGSGISNPVSPARTLFLKGGSSAICAHFHQVSEQPFKRISGKIIACWSIGCLCNMHSDYRPMNQWGQGFAIVERSGEEFKVDNMKIIDGKVY